MRDHDEAQLPGPPRLRKLVAAVVLVMAAAFLAGWLPFTATSVGLALLVVGAGLLS